MNIILFAILILAALIMAHAILKPRFQREECHNSKTPKEAAEEEAPSAVAQSEEKASVEIPEPVAEVPAAIPELEIITKIQAGLTRDQAIEVITNQRAHDAAQG